VLGHENDATTSVLLLLQERLREVLQSLVGGGAPANAVDGAAVGIVITGTATGGAGATGVAGSAVSGDGIVVNFSHVAASASGDRSPSSSSHSSHVDEEDTLLVTEEAQSSTRSEEEDSPTSSRGGMRTHEREEGSSAQAPLDSLPAAVDAGQQCVALLEALKAVAAQNRVSSSWHTKPPACLCLVSCVLLYLRVLLHGRSCFFFFRSSVLPVSRSFLSRDSSFPSPSPSLIGGP
jgi:hypothetical protein